MARPTSPRQLSRTEPAGFSIPNDHDVGFNDFCTADSEVAVSEALSDAAIVQSVTADNQAAHGPTAAEDDDDEVTDVDDSCERRPVSAGDAMNALAVLGD